MKLRIALLALAASSFSPLAEAAGGTIPLCEETPLSVQTQRVYEALTPQCKGCHSEGTRGFFGSILAFQSLLVGDARLVTPGDPDASELVRLLEGHGTGAFDQMPIGGEAYARDDAAIRMSEIRAWITSLPPQLRAVRPDPDAPMLTRMSAPQIQRALYLQLGLAYEDFFRPGRVFDVDHADIRDDDDYPFQSPDALPAPRERSPAERSFHLGGGSVLTQVEAHPDISSTFVHALTALSQRWCRIALAKRGNVALFPAKTPMSREKAAVKATIRRWSRSFHGETMTNGEIDALYTSLFVPIERAGGVEPAHVGLCSYFIRHPRWIFY